MVEPEDRRQPNESCACPAEDTAHALEKVADRQHTVRPDQGQDLVRGDEKGDRVDDPKKSQDDEPRQPIARAFLLKDSLECVEAHSRSRNITASAAPTSMAAPAPISTVLSGPTGGTLKTPLIPASAGSLT